ncbi:STAS domain-containing protein [Actinomadura scrupuli]|uniref:STAS domain-containing protein n=1 Tax=Actinomadura scrupuli TaxID=559629 RepID=UPI003D96D91C
MTATDGFAGAARTTGPYEIIELRGELDIAYVPALRAQITVILRERDPGRLVLDLTGLEFIDSTGLSVLVWAHRRLSERGNRLCLVAPGAQVRRILRVTGLHERLNVHQTVEDALALPSSDRPRPEGHR